MIYEKVFDIDQSNITNVEEAIEFAELFVFDECQTHEQLIAFSNHIDTINDVGIHYCYGADHYFFTDEGES